MPQGFPDILEIVEKSRSGVKPCDNLKFSEKYRRCQPHGCGKCGDRILSVEKHFSCLLFLTSTSKYKYKYKYKQVHFKLGFYSKSKKSELNFYSIFA